HSGAGCKSTWEKSNGTEEEEPRPRRIFRTQGGDGAACGGANTPQRYGQILSRYRPPRPRAMGTCAPGRTFRGCAALSNDDPRIVEDPRRKGPSPAMSIRMRAFSHAHILVCAHARSRDRTMRLDSGNFCANTTASMEVLYDRSACGGQRYSREP